jgi:hypothetical protein
VTEVARAGWNNFRAMVTGYEIAPAAAPSTESSPAANPLGQGKSP